jgi:predicted metalloprotease with PDZ domain
MKLETILKIVEEETKTNLRAKNRRRELVYSRAIYYKLARVHSRDSLARIAGIVGRDHATALHGLKVFDQQISVYEDAREYLEIYNKLVIHIKKENGLREKEINPAAYYRKKYASALLALRQERKESRLLKNQLLINS